jgi:AcrR family transcriptional regulator
MFRPIETELTRLLRADRTERPDALHAFRVARRWFLDGRRVDVGELATELEISRATLFRWVGNRDQLLGEILWSMTEDVFNARSQAAQGTGAERIADVVGEFVRTVNDAPAFRAFLLREPERALRILTTKASVIQGRTMSKLEELLNAEIEAGELSPPLPVPDLAYLIVRIAESFIYTDVITGGDPDATKARAAIATLLG